MKNILTVIGTRPECIKLAPLAIAFTDSKSLSNKICITRQHTSLLDSLFLSSNLKIDYQFKSCKKKASLSQSAAHMLSQFNDLLEKTKPDLIIVQGDTTTAFIAALAGFYADVKVAHVEAGLRTGNLRSPWPEEAHRVLIDKISNYFFVPTQQAKINLTREGVDENKIWVVGNTSIDAVRLIKEASSISGNLRTIIVTIHRRENHGEVLIEICNALKIIASEFPDIKIIFCLHPNPSVYATAIEHLSAIDNIELIQPMDHFSFIQLLYKCTFVLTDSGGLQEEMTFIGKPLLIARDVTERIEVIKAGNGILVGTKSQDIIQHCKALLENPELLLKMSHISFPYGDGYAAQHIVKILEQEL